MRLRETLVSNSLTQTNMIIFSLFSPLYTHLSMWPSAHKSMHMHIRLLKNAHSTDKSVHTDKVISGWEFRVLVVCGLVTKKTPVSLINLGIYTGEFKTTFFFLSHQQHCTKQHPKHKLSNGLQRTQLTLS